LQQEIPAVADATIQKYNEVTSFEDKSDVGVANAMRAGTKEKALKLTIKMDKLLAVANPVNGLGFLQEVHFVLKNSLLLPMYSPSVIRYEYIFFLLQVEKHWSSNEVPKMTWEKFQMVATNNTTSY